MEHRRFGRSGFEASIAILGGSAFAGISQRQAEVCLEFAMNMGVNRLDVTSALDNSEEVLGEVTAGCRELLFISGKSRRRNPSSVHRQMLDSIEKLDIGMFDLYQAQAVNSVGELDQRTSAIEQIFRARDTGLTSLVGISGNGLGAPAAHLVALSRFDLDSVSFALYPRAWAESSYRNDVKALVKECSIRDVGVQVTRALGRRPWPQDSVRHLLSYEPQTSAYTIQRALNFVLSIEGVHGFCTPEDLSMLPQVLKAATNYAAMDRDRRAAAMATTLWSEELIS